MWGLLWIRRVLLHTRTKRFGGYRALLALLRDLNQNKFMTNDNTAEVNYLESGIIDILALQRMHREFCIE